MLNAEEAETPDQIIQTFEQIFNQRLQEDINRYSEKPSLRQQYRVLKESLRSEDFRKLPLDQKGAQILTSYLLESEKYSDPFLDWMRTRDLHARLNTLPRNTGLIFYAGQQIITTKFSRHQSKPPHPPFDPSSKL